MRRLGAIPVRNIGSFVPPKRRGKNVSAKDRENLSLPGSGAIILHSEFYITPAEALHAARVLTGISFQRGVPEGQNRQDVIDVLSAVGLLRTKQELGFTR